MSINDANMFMDQHYNRQISGDFALKPVTTETLWARMNEKKCLFDSIAMSDRNKVFGLACPCGKCSAVSC